MDRTGLVRRLLGAGTQLFINDADPFTVHCLTCSAGEHAAFLARSVSGTTFNDHIAVTFPEKGIEDIRKLRNQYWTPIKHASSHGGKPKDVEKELFGFSDADNDHMLFVVWYDYMMSDAPLPIEAQVFQIWYFEMYPEKLDPQYVLAEGRTQVFPEIQTKPRSEQKRELRKCCAFYRDDKDLMSHPKTDPQTLILLGPE